MDLIEADIRKKAPDLDRELDFKRYDLSQDRLEAIVSEMSAPSFTGGAKVAIVKNVSFILVNNSKNIQTKRDMEAFDSFLSSPDPVNLVYLVMPLKTGNSNLAKKIKTHSIYVECPRPVGDELVMRIMAMASKAGSGIDRNTAAQIAQRAGDDWCLLRNTVAKLSVYTDKIDMAAVEALVPRKPEDRIFAITDAMFSGRTITALKAYRDMRKQGTDPLGCLAFFFSNFRFLAETLYLRRMRYSNDMAARRMEVSPYRVNAVLRQAGRMSSQTCVKILCELHDIEKGIKYDLDDGDNRIESFILNFSRNYL